MKLLSLNCDLCIEEPMLLKHAYQTSRGFLAQQTKLYHFFIKTLKRNCCHYMFNCNLCLEAMLLKHAYQTPWGFLAQQTKSYHFFPKNFGHGTVVIKLWPMYWNFANWTVVTYVLSLCRWNTPSKCPEAQLVEYKNNCPRKRIENPGMSCNSLWICGLNTRSENSSLSDYFLLNQAVPECHRNKFITQKVNMT